MTRQGADWDFPYQPAPTGTPGDQSEVIDVVVALRRAVEATVLSEALRSFGPGLDVELLIDRAPLHWLRVRSPARASQLEVADALSHARVPVRYVASARVGAMSMPPPLGLSRVLSARAVGWAARKQRAVSESTAKGGRWFLGEGGGVRVDRRVCGTGAGTRLAVVEDDTADFEHLEIDRLECVGVTNAPTASGHGALMVGWAVGALRPDGSRFAGVAPDASVRVYCTPKPGIDVVSLPLAIARAVLDGADVVLCPTYVEGTTSPLMDDALEVAVHLGRRGRGSVVVLPTGRETSSPGSSVHASLSLHLGDPASDPRVHCVAPGGQRGGWFLWKSPRGKLRPFSNRGPAVRWLAPGDDMAYPFSARERLFHGESSGASAVAAGVMLLVLGCNPRLRLAELQGILARTVDVPDREILQAEVLADTADLLPLGRDRDGHDAKCGYGRFNATRACAAARDPVALELTAMGHDELARQWSVRPSRAYSQKLARWAVRALLARPDLEHSLRVALRHARLVAGDASRSDAHARGALARHLYLLIRELLNSTHPTPLVQHELERLLEPLQLASSGSQSSVAAVLDDAVLELFGDLRQRDRVGFGIVRGEVRSITS
jgi:hypothetical protein